MQAIKPIRPAIRREIEGPEAVRVLQALAREEETAVGLLIREAEIPLDALPALELRDCRLEGCRITGSAAGLAGRPSLVETVLDGCDLAGADLSGAVLRRVELRRCRAVGLLLARSLGYEVRLTECVCRYLNLSASEWKKAAFAGCDLSGASIEEVKLPGAVLTGCNLTGAELLRTPLGGIDLTSDQLDGISLGGGELRGAVVTRYQASELARLLGVVIQDAAPEAGGSGG
ncbi:MAG TPA: pentapeptide repeat-containing protein [Firmicutes bacterium]|nr:pentapeptide repeat-containing protein [Bacillota bacterium]